jgi:hypothetical protein
MNYDNYVKYKKKYLNLKKSKSNKILKGGGIKKKNISWTNKTFQCDRRDIYNKKDKSTISCLYDGKISYDGKSEQLDINGFWNIKYISEIGGKYTINALFNMYEDPNKKMLEWQGVYDIKGNFKGSLRHLPEYVAEIYEFEILNYTNNKKTENNYNYNFKFKNFDKKENGCGKIEVERDLNMDEGDPDNIKYFKSCDNIGDTEENNAGILEKLKGNKQLVMLYLNVYVKLNPKLNIAEFEMTGEYNINYFCNDVQEKINSLLEKYKNIEQINKIVEKGDNSSYIYKINFDENQKIIVIGDIHGSFHTFFRLFMRMVYLDIINVDDFIIKEGYTIIFLGDVLDRGAYQIETLYLIYNLLCANFIDDITGMPKIIYNRGNHEDDKYALYDDDGSENFKKEIDIKCGSYGNLGSENNQLLKYFPVAIIVNNLYWLCHGGIPDRSKELFIDIKNFSDEIFEIEEILASQIMWNDFYNEPENGINDLRTSNDSDAGCRNIGINTINDFLDSGFKFIIRGHSDDLSNTWLLTDKYNNNNNIYTYDIASDLNNAIKDFIVYNTASIADRYFALLHLNLPNKNIKDHNKTTIYPVLTISTNTANERHLNRDSFIILRIPKEQEFLSPERINLPIRTSSSQNLHYPSNSRPSAGLVNSEHLDLLNKLKKKFPTLEPELFKDKFIKLNVIGDGRCGFYASLLSAYIELYDKEPTHQLVKDIDSLGEFSIENIKIFLSKINTDAVYNYIKEFFNRGQDPVRAINMMDTELLDIYERELGCLKNKLDIGTYDQTIIINAIRYKYADLNIRIITDAYEYIPNNNTDIYIYHLKIHFFALVTIENAKKLLLLNNKASKIVKEHNDEKYIKNNNMTVYDRIMIKILNNEQVGYKDIDSFSAQDKQAISDALLLMKIGSD